MKIVSLNAWGGAVFEVLDTWLRQIDPDVLCLQEVTRTPGLSGWTHFSDGERSLPQRANLLDDVCAVLSQHQTVFLASDAGPVADTEGASHQQDFGIAMFIRDTFPVVGHSSAFVHGEFTEHTQWAIEDRPRVAHAARVVDRNGDRTVTIAHLHGLRDRAGKADTPARHAQAKRLRTLVKDASAPGDFVAVCGDMNLLPDSETFDTLGELGLVDLVGDADTRTSLYKKPARSANYFLVSDPDAVRSFSTPAYPEVSDHRPLILTI